MEVTITLSRDEVARILENEAARMFPMPLPGKYTAAARHSYIPSVEITFTEAEAEEPVLATQADVQAAMQLECAQAGRPARETAKAMVNDALGRVHPVFQGALDSMCPPATEAR